MPQIEAPWAKIPLHVIQDDELTAGDLRVYGAIDYLAGKRGWWFGSLDEIAKRSGVSKASAYRASVKLRERGYISTVAMGLAKANVLRYLIHARTIDAEAVVTDDDDAVNVVTDDDAPSSPTPTTAVVTDDDDNNTDLPQTKTTDLRARAREAPPPKVRQPVIGSSCRQWYEYHVNPHPDRELRRLLSDLSGSHPPECVAWAWQQAIARVPTERRWPYVLAILNGHDREGHGPRDSSAQRQPAAGVRDIAAL